MRCSRCSEWTERYTVTQTRRCRRCDAEVQRLIAADAQRRTPRFPFAKELTTWRVA